MRTLTMAAGEILIPGRMERSRNNKSTKEEDMQVCISFFYLGLIERRNAMKYQVQENCLTIFLPKELDHHNAEDIRKESDHLIERNHIRYVIFDFADTIFCDSSGIGVIMGRYKRIYMLGGEVCAVHTNERMKKMLVMSGITKIMQIYEEEK